MFHWTDNRIKGHLVVCYIAFVFIRYIQEKTALTENELRKTLSQMQFSKVQTHQETLWMRSAETTNTKTIIEKLKLKKIPDTSSDKNINNYIQTFL
jgi:transposase